MSKRKRTGDSGLMSNDGQKKPSRRRAHQTSNDDDIIVIDLENDTSGASSSKKSKVDRVEKASSSRGSPLTTNQNQKSLILAKLNFSTPPKPSFLISNGSQKENEDDSGDVPDAGRPEDAFFKVPDIPRPKVTPSSSKPNTSTAVVLKPNIIRQKKTKNKPSAKQMEMTTASRNLRRAVIDALKDALDDANNGPLSLKNLIDNIKSLIPSRMHMFATRRLPEGLKFEDFSLDAEVEEFARWWLFGITGLLFSLPDSLAKKWVFDTISVISTLCQVLLCGHPGIVDKLGIPMMRLLKNLLIRNGGTTDADFITKLEMYSTLENGTKEFFEVKVKLTENNDWILPHYLQAIAPLLARISCHSVKIFHLFNDLLQKYLTRVMTPEAVEAVLVAFPSFLLTDAHGFYMTERTLSNIYKRILEASTDPKMEIIEFRHAFGRHDVLQNHRYLDFLQDSGLGLLQLGIKEYLYSNQFASINKDNLNVAIVHAFKFIIDTTGKSSSQLVEEVVPLTKYVANNGLDTVLHPLLQEIIVTELLSYASNKWTNDPKEASKVWKGIFKAWDSKLIDEYKSISSRNESTSIPDEVQEETLSFFCSTAALAKLVSSVFKQLKELGFHRYVQFFELKHFQRWLDICIHSLANGLKLSPIHLHRLYFAILETMDHLDSCSWFTAELSMRFLNNLLCLPGWLWLSRFDRSIPQKLKPLPVYARKFKNSDLNFIRGSSLLTQQAIQTLRLEVFRPWSVFISEVYLSVMEGPTVFADQFLAIGILRAISEVSWIFKEVIPLTSTFTFLDLLIKSDLWIRYSGVRSALAEAIAALPCICHYNGLRNRKNYRTHVPLASKSGCEKLKCSTFDPRATTSTKREQHDEDANAEELKELYITSIVKLAWPLLKSKFLLLKLTLSNLITTVHNHVRAPSAAVIIPMIDVAFSGHTLLCEEIFRKVGKIVADMAATNSTDDKNATGEELVIAQKIFSSAIPQLCTRSDALNRRNRLPLRTREKIIKGILAFSNVGTIKSMSIFLEIFKCIIPIVAQTRGNENSVTILSQNIVAHFAEVHNCQPHELMTRVRYDISKCVLKSALNAFYIKGWSEHHHQNHHRLAMCVKFIERLKYIGKFRLSFERYFFPPLMELIVPKIQESHYQFILTSLASHMKDTELIVLQEYIMNYFPTLLLDRSSEQITSCLSFLKNYYGFDAMFAAKQQEQRILNETLCRLADREEKVLRFLSHLCKWDDQSSKLLFNQGTANKMHRSEIQEVLSQRLLGFFIHLDTKLQSRLETVETKQRIIRSFTALLKLMGSKRINPVRSKVYKTLYSAAKEGVEYHEVLYDAWKEFANCLDSTSFKAMTPQILASLLPLRETPSVRTKVDGLVSHFVVFKKDLTAEHYEDLYFLLDQCENLEVIEIVGNAIDKLKQKSWSKYFNMVVNYASHENPPIRYEAFRKLRDIFRFDWDKVERFVLVKGQQYVSQMISTMMSGLRGTGNSEDEKLREIIVDCFGCIGALDPVRFRSGDDDGSGNVNKIATSVSISCEIHVFVLLYLRKLIKEFMEVKDTTNFDYCACLIQIVLKEFKVNPNDENDKIWKWLKDEQREIVTPMFTTKYQMDNGVDIPALACPIYLSEAGQSFETWLINWMCTLISYLTVSEPLAYSLFRKSMNVLKTNIRIATFVIPFVALYAVFCATKEQLSNIVTEIKTILERWVELDKMKRKAQSITPVRDSEFENGLKEEAISVENESVFHARCTQVVFSVLDHLLRTSSFASRKLGLKKANEAARHYYRPDPRQSLPMTENNLMAVESVLTQIPKILISEVACNCGAFPAALYYLEQELKTNPYAETLQQNLDYLQRLYICLDDMDSVSGIGSVRTGDQSFACQILENIMNGKTQESVKSLEQMTIRDTDDFQLHQALVRAYLKVEEPHAAETFIKATLVRQPEWEIDLQEVHLEALAKLQKWSELSAKVDDLETMKGNQHLEDKFLTWNIAIPRIISKLQRGQPEAAAGVVQEFKTALVAPLVATSEELYPYKMAYPYIVQLHILTEIDDVIKLIRKHTNSVASGKTGWLSKEVTRMVSKWESRLWNVSKSRKMIDQILSVRKNLFEIMKTAFHTNTLVCDSIRASIRECWLDVARDASKCGDFVRADNCLREAKRFMSPKVMIEEAKILNRKGEKANAVTALQAGIALYFPQILRWKTEKVPDPVVVRTSAKETAEAVIDPDAATAAAAAAALQDQKLLCSKAILLHTRLCEEQKLLNMEDYIAKYKDAAEVYKKSEKNFFTLGSYHDRLWSAADKTPSTFEIQATVVRYYSQSLSYGCKYVYQSLPRLLSIWFDFAAGLHAGEFGLQAPAYSSSSSSSSSSIASSPPGRPEKVLANMETSINKMSASVPTYILLTAFTQLVSRLCHAHVKTWTLLKEIIVNIIKTHPYQTLWMTMSVNKSVNPMRRRRCQEIFKQVEKESNMREKITNYTALSERLIELCDKHIPKEWDRPCLSKIFNKLPQLVKQMGKEKVLVPFQVFLNPLLPRKGINHLEHLPYPEVLVYIESFDDLIEVMSSLIRPKKITLRASNGEQYSLLCKPKDDLRKDSKVMEVNNVVNWYLAQNSESSQRRLHVRTYSVVPLNEECGLLEWVPNLTTFRHALNTLYKEKNITTYRPITKDMKIELFDDLSVKRRKFIEYMLKQTPSVFGDWFFNQFSDHQSWYTARMSYTRTAAVISIVGYIMGLGDRHCENILLDTATGELVHVDFNCLFNKGETFMWPERVPFRLTHNMVDGMGPLKHEGVFRKSCEIVMNMFREHKSIFLSVLRPFVFDPLVEWQKRDRGAMATLESGELTNERAVETMKYIRHRLNGTARNKMRDINTELSVEAHVDYLIEEATSVDNLCQMFLGWAGYM